MVAIQIGHQNKHIALPYLIYCAFEPHGIGVTQQTI